MDKYALACAYQELLRYEYNKLRLNEFKFTANSRLTWDEIVNVVKDQRLVNYMLSEGLVIPYEDNTYRTIHLVLVEKALGIRSVYTFPPVPLEHKIILCEEPLRHEREPIEKLRQVVSEYIGNKILAEALIEALKKAYPKLSKFQYIAILNILKSMKCHSAKAAGIIAPTAYGKTVIFLIPVLAHILHEKHASNVKQGPKVFLIYPRKSLAREQLARLIKVIHVLNSVLEKKGLKDYKVTLGIWDSDSPRLHNIKSDLKNFVTFRGICFETSEGTYELWRIDPRKISKKELGVPPGYGAYLVSRRGDGEYDESKVFFIDFVTDIKDYMEREPPDILITNFYVINYRLMVPRTQTLFGLDNGKTLSKPSLIVIDEGHVYSSIIGAIVHYIIRRLKAKIRVTGEKEPFFIVSTATIGNPREFIAQLVGVNISDVILLDYNETRDPETGIKVRDFDVYEDPTLPNKEKEKRKRLSKLTLHLVLAPVPYRTGEWLLQQLITMITAWSIAYNTKFIAFIDSVERTKTVWHYVTNIIMKRWLKEVRADMGEQYRHLYSEFVKDPKHAISDSFSWIPLVTRKIAKSINPSLPVNKVLEEIINGDKEVFKELKRLSNQMRDMSTKLLGYHNAKLPLPQRIYVESLFASEKSGLVGLISTSTLELGIDVSRVAVVVQFRMPRKYESYVQRVGRAGRSLDVMFTSLGILVLTNNPNDLWYIYSGEVEKLIKAEEHVPPQIILPLDNSMVKRWSIIYAIFDYLALKGLDTYITPRRSWKKNIENMLNDIKKLETNLEANLKNIIDYAILTLGLPENEVVNVIETFVKTIKRIRIGLEDLRDKLDSVREMTKNCRKINTFEYTDILINKIAKQSEKLTDIINVCNNTLNTINDKITEPQLKSRIKPHIDILRSLQSNLSQLQQYLIELRENTTKILKEALISSDLRRKIILKIEDLNKRIITIIDDIGSKIGKGNLFDDMKHDLIFALTTAIIYKQVRTTSMVTAQERVFDEVKKENMKIEENILRLKELNSLMQHLRENIDSLYSSIASNVLIYAYRLKALGVKV